MDLSTSYMGLKLSNPLIASSSPHTADLDKMKAMEESGAAAIVLPSLFEEQVTLESKQLNENLLQGTESFSEALSYFPDFEQQPGTDQYLELVRKAKETLTLPIIGSLNGVSTGGWTECAKRIEEAGADALELNIYFLPTDVHVMGNQVEQMYATLVKNIVSQVTIPVAVKVGPFFSAIPNVLKRLDQAGARGLVLFNRFYQPDINLSDLTVSPRLKLSSSDELLLRLRWVSILSETLDADIAVTGGVHTAEDAIKCILTGAKTVMMTSAIIQNSPNHFATVLKKMISWMESKSYNHLSEMQGILNHKNVAEPAAFERANYMKIIGFYNK